MSEEKIGTQLQLVQRLAREFSQTIIRGLHDREAKCFDNMAHVVRNRDLYACNHPAVQPLREFFRAYPKRYKLLFHVMSPDSFLLALQQELKIAEAETLKLYGEN